MSRMDIREFHEWQAYWKVTGGWGPERDTLNAGMIAATTYASHGGKRTKPRQLQYYLDWIRGKRQRRPAMSDDQIRAVATKIQEGIGRK